MTAALTINDLYPIIGVVLGLLTVVLIAGAIAGQFRRGVIDELRTSLSTANTELQVHRGIIDRLNGDIATLQGKVASMENANMTLSDAIRGGAYLAPVVKAELEEMEKRLSAVLQDSRTR